MLSLLSHKPWKIVFIIEPSPIAGLSGAFSNIQGLLYYKTKWLQSSMICHEAVAMVFFLKWTVHSPMFTSGVECIVETLRIWISIHLQKYIQASCCGVHISYWSEKTSPTRRQTIHEMGYVPKFLGRRNITPSLHTPERFVAMNLWRTYERKRQKHNVELGILFPKSPLFVRPRH